MDWPTYTHERNFGCRAIEYVYRGLRTVTLENEALRVTVLADKGSDIIEFLHKPSDTDFMWRSPLGVRNPATFVPTAPRPEGAFLDYYPGGWQECLPSGGNATQYAGTSFGPHGEVGLIPWEYALTEDRPDCVSLLLRVRTYRTPLYLEKRLTLNRGRPVLHIHERLVNEGLEPLDLMWGHHPAFGPPFLDPSCVVDLPGARIRATDASPTHRYQAGEDYQWPFVSGRDGAQIDISVIPPPETRTHDTVFLSDLRAGWYAVTNTNRRVGFGMAWPVELFHTLWFWQVYGGAFGSPWFGRTYNIALEPWTTAHTTIEEAIAHGTQRRLAPGEALEVDLCAVAYTGLRRVHAIALDGSVTGAQD
ncbi:MAG: aldose 1-epimerase [Oscillochloris sp.]|nr:aldose 1-epimerase [Oscillochloris sp.]